MTTATFAVCIKNTGYEASLELRKIYQVLKDDRSLLHGQLRVIDESGEDYLFPQDFFAHIDLPGKLAAGFSAAA